MIPVSISKHSHKTYRDHEASAGVGRDRERRTGHDRDRERRTGHDRDRERRTGHDRDRERRTGPAWTLSAECRVRQRQRYPSCRVVSQPPAVSRLSTAVTASWRFSTEVSITRSASSGSS